MTKSKPSSPDQRSLSAPKKALYTAVCLLFILLLCEAGLRLRSWKRYGTTKVEVTSSLLIRDKSLGLSVPRPGHQQHGGKASIAINALGFRGDEVTLEKPPKTLRIVCMGASTTFCSEASSNITVWPSRLQAILQKQFPKINVEVINAGVPGYRVAQTRISLEKRVLPLNPDLVLLYHANNDIAFDTGRLAADLGLTKPKSGRHSGLLKSLSKASILFDLLYKNLTIATSGGGKHAKKLSAIPPDLPARFIGEISQVREELRKHNIPLVMSAFLVKYRRDQPRDQQIANADVSFYYMPWMTIDLLLDAIDLYNDALLDHAREHAVPFISDRESVPPDDTHYADAMHMTDQGCARFAQRVASFLEQNKILEPIARKISDSP